jgi:hypothetical protein
MKLYLADEIKLLWCSYSRIVPARMSVYSRIVPAIQKMPASAHFHSLMMPLSLTGPQDFNLKSSSNFYLEIKRSIWNQVYMN